MPRIETDDSGTMTLVDENDDEYAFDHWHLSHGALDERVRSRFRALSPRGQHEYRGRVLEYEHLVRDSTLSKAVVDAKLSTLKLLRDVLPLPNSSAWVLLVPAQLLFLWVAWHPTWWTGGLAGIAIGVTLACSTLRHWRESERETAIQSGVDAAQQLAKRAENLGLNLRVRSTDGEPQWEQLIRHLGARQCILNAIEKLESSSAINRGRWRYKYYYIFDKVS